MGKKALATRYFTLATGLFPQKILVIVQLVLCLELRHFKNWCMFLSEFKLCTLCKVQELLE